MFDDNFIHMTAGRVKKIVILVSTHLHFNSCGGSHHDINHKFQNKCHQIFYVIIGFQFLVADWVRGM
jgi:hypothetical protein